jgi:hypothetical protein
MSKDFSSKPLTSELLTEAVGIPWPRFQNNSLSQEEIQSPKGSYRIACNVPRKTRTGSTSQAFPPPWLLEKHTTVFSLE